MPGIWEPSQYPARVIPMVHASPLRICQRVNTRQGTPMMPAVGFITVRTTGMNRARVMARAGPYRVIATSARLAARRSAGRSVRSSSRRPTTWPRW